MERKWPSGDVGVVRVVLVEHLLGLIPSTAKPGTEQQAYNLCSSGGKKAQGQGHSQLLNNSHLWHERTL